MVGLAECMFLVLSLAQFSLGLLANGFVGLVSVRDWIKSKRVSLRDFIVISLAFSKIFLLSLLLVDSALLVFSPKEHGSGVFMQAIDVFWTFSNHLNVWLVTCLGVLYCLKIATFSQPAFLWLKWRGSRVVVWLLLGALLFSCSRVVSLTQEFKVYADWSRSSDTENATESDRKKRKYMLLHTLSNLWNLPPLLLLLASCFLLLLSLGRHTRRMQHMGASRRDLSIEAHRRAIRVILSFSLLFLLYFLAFHIASFSRFLPQTKVAIMTGEAITMLYLAGHSFILILGSTKLKQAFVELLLCECVHLRPGTVGPFSP